MVIRLVPPLILAPLTGTIADSYDKRKVMATCNIASAIVVLGFLAVRTTTRLGLFFVVAFLQQSLFAQYDPTRRALVPDVVTGESELKGATTADAFAWSIMMAVGAASGGAIVAKFGRDANFIADAVTYLLSAALCLAVRPVDSRKDVLKDTRYTGGEASSWASAASDGLRYICGDRELLAVLCIKGSAAVNWGMSELLEVQLAAEPRMQSWGGLPSTLGVVYAATGLGCVLGPVMFGALTGSDTGSYRRAIVGAFALSSLSALLVAVAASLGPVAVAAFLRACGSSVIWIYSTLLVQRICRPAFFGRVFAAEMCIFTACKCAGLLLASTLLDGAHLSPNGTAAAMLGISALAVSGWGHYLLCSLRSVPSLPGAVEGGGKAPASEKASERVPLLAESTDGAPEGQGA